MSEFRDHLADLAQSQLEERENTVEKMDKWINELNGLLEKMIEENEKLRKLL